MGDDIERINESVEERPVGEEDIEEQENVCMLEEPVELENAMDTDSDELDISIEDKFGGEMSPDEARRILYNVDPHEVEGESEK